MKKEEQIKDYSHLRRDLLKILINVGLLFILIIGLSFLDSKTGFISKMASQIMSLLIK